MKNGKHPTLAQKKFMKSHGLDPENHLVVKNTQEFLEVVSKTALKKKNCREQGQEQRSFINVKKIRLRRWQIIRKPLLIL